MYDFAHGQSDAIEGITHSICTLEFEVNRPLYDWFIENLPVPHRPHQIEFARLNLTYTVMSKRKLLRLVQEGHVSGWDDPRMPTIRGLRRRGYTPESIREFSDRIGVAKRDSHRRPRPARVGHPRGAEPHRPAGDGRAAAAEGRDHQLPRGPGREDRVREQSRGRERRHAPGAVLAASSGSSRTTSARSAPRKFFRLKPGSEVRLKHAYFITCDEVIKDDDGKVVELRCTYDPATRGGDSPDGRKVKGTLHWVSARARRRRRGAPLRPPVQGRPSPRRAATSWPT